MDSAISSIDPNPQTPHRDAARLGAEITELCAYIYAATYRLLVLIREFDEAEGWHGAGLVTCAHWLNFQCGIGMNAAREKVRVAHALKGLPKISAGFARGELSYSKVRAMTRVANEDNEDYLLMIAKHGTAHHMDKLVQKFRWAERLQDCETANRQQRERFVDYHYDHDGCLVFKARLPAEQGALVVKALEKVLDEQFRQHSDDKADQVPSGRTSESEPETRPEHERDSARRADALSQIAETSLQNPETQGSSADRYQVVVHVTADQLPPGQTSLAGVQKQACLQDDPHVTAVTSLSGVEKQAWLQDGPHVTAETARRLACDCSMLRVLEDTRGKPLSVGRKTRAIPPAIRRALDMRDRGCRFPGCTNTRFVDGHHIQHWADGGETSLDNLVQLCRHHHRLVHEGGYGCERHDGGNIVFTAPDERTLPEYAATPAIAQDPYAWFEREMNALGIGATSCIPHWYAGEHMDWDLAVAGLFDCRSRMT